MTATDALPRPAVDPDRENKFGLVKAILSHASYLRPEAAFSLAQAILTSPWGAEVRELRDRVAEQDRGQAGGGAQ